MQDPIERKVHPDERLLAPQAYARLMAGVLPENQAAAILAEMDKKEEEEEQFAKYGEKYAKSDDDHWVDRHGESLAPELAEFSLNPEQSRSYYTRKKVKDWYDLCLSSANNILEPNKIYLSVDASNMIQYTVLAPNGIPVTASTLIRAEPNPLGMRQVIREKEHILKVAVSEGHIQPSAYPYYEGIPCINLPESQGVADILIPEGHVGLAFNRGKPVFLAPGMYQLPQGFTLPHEHIVPTTSKHIVHGTMHIIRVEGQALWQVTDPTKMDDFKILTQGTHVVELPSGTVLEVQETNKTVLWVKGAEEAKKPKPEAKAEVKAEAKGEAKAEKPKEDEKVPAGRKPGRVIFVKVAQGKVAVCYDNEGQLRILKPGMFYLPPSWTFYDYISYKKNIEKVTLESIKSKDNLTHNVEANVRYQIIDPYHAVKEFGPNGIYKAIKDAAAEAVKIEFNSKSIVFDNQSQQVDPSLPAPAYQDWQAPPPDYDNNSKAVQNMNAQLKDGKIKIHKVSIMKYTPSHPSVLKAIEDASAARIDLMKSRAELEAMRLKSSSQDIKIDYLRKQIEVRKLEREDAKAQAILMREIALDAVETSKILNATPGARPIFENVLERQAASMAHAQMPDAFFNRGNQGASVAVHVAENPENAHANNGR